MIAGSLEQNILEVFSQEGAPLNVLEIWDALIVKKIQVPVLYLNKVLTAMTRLNMLETVGDRMNYPAYQPTEYRFSNYRKLFKSIFKRPQDGKKAGATQPQKN